MGLFNSRNFVFAFMLLASNHSFGASNACKNTLDELFRTSFFDEQIYCEFLCHKNIHRLLKIAVTKGIDIQNAEALYIGRVDGGPIYGQATRTGLVQWTGRSKDGQYAGYHFVLKVGDRIYDFDYGVSPSAPPIQEYFVNQFGEQLNSPFSSSRFFVIAIPAKDWVDGNSQKLVGSYPTYWADEFAKFGTKAVPMNSRQQK